MIRTLLIANRGEIAVRVARTARRLGIRTVAVFSEADRGAPHVALADAAEFIGPAPARDSYLDIAAVVAAARRAGADAVHPGYGFLSENAEFADSCAAAGLVFVGPPAAAIRAMGSKAAAKALMTSAGVPVVPGYHGEDQEPARLAQEAERVGYPVLIKASAGGGGRGMRAADGPAAFPAALAAARGEALSAFGDDRVLIERQLVRPRHIEVQVFADRHGDVVHLFERDCSVQRRHQKVVEEAPAPGLPAERRAAMGRAACDAARAVGYEGAGTVEFIAEGDAFFFMEMNTRLQVEHPVTEMVTGQDLVEWQIRIAEGRPLPLDQGAIPLRGHAIEARLYAEDPSEGDRPSTGVLRRLRWPVEGPDLRVEAGVAEGDRVTVHYDPMLAKLVASGETRADALRRLGAALGDTEVAGVSTNLAMLRAILRHPEFAAGAVDTGFLARHPALREPPAAPPDAALAAAALLVIRERAAESAAGDPHSPWAAPDGWRLGGPAPQTVLLARGAAVTAVRALPRPGGAFALDIDGRRIEVAPDGDDAVRVDGARRRAAAVRDGGRVWGLAEGESFVSAVVDPLAAPAAAGAAETGVVAPMPGRIASVGCAPGQAVRRGDVLVVLEAMKVQMRLPAPRDGVVAAVRAAAGDIVDEGVELVALAPIPETPEGARGSTAVRRT